MKRTAPNAEADTKEAAVKGNGVQCRKEEYFDRFYDWFMGKKPG